jgi:hypothetical protein
LKRLGADAGRNNPKPSLFRRSANYWWSLWSDERADRPQPLPLPPARRGSFEGGRAAPFVSATVGLQKEKPVKYLVPPIVIPVLLVIGIAAYALLKPPIMISHPAAASANAQPR